MRSKKTAVIALGLLIFFVFGALLCAPLSFGQTDSSSPVAQSTSGTVQEIDWVGGKLVVNTTEDEQIFVVPSDAVLTRGSETIGLSDIDQGDEVQIEFINTLSGLRVIRLNDNNMANAE